MWGPKYAILFKKCDLLTMMFEHSTALWFIRSEFLDGKTWLIKVPGVNHNIVSMYKYLKFIIAGGINATGDHSVSR